MSKQAQTQSKQQEWKSVTVRLKENNLAILNSKLKTNGFDTFSQFVHAWIKGNYPAHENNDQVEKLLNRIRDKGVSDPLTGEFSPTFYRNVNLEDMLKDLSKRYIYQKHANDKVGYGLLPQIPKIHTVKHRGRLLVGLSYDGVADRTEQGD
jgi:hypothetical protein